ncbi:MAG: Lrp/AsnC family transcriptional regulator [Gammaproteobacteria bacterium]|jgi:Lrp/AsnC family transcriptional regulator, leucine-responsive regulatory protein|nr:Lrp/AsnC family transcriptional regulator [Gammaproteobacteria bacterium]
MDKIDYRILDELQVECRLSSQVLADRVGLSTSQCWRRVKNLEEMEAIQANVAILDPLSIGLQVTALANINLIDHQPDTVADFYSVVQSRKEILECWSTSGEHDFILKIVSESIASYDDLLNKYILQCRAVNQLSSSIVLRSIKHTTALPLPL